MRARPCIGCAITWSLPTLDIFLSHTHLDHVIGLTFLFDVLFEKQVERVRVHGEAGKLAALREHLFSETLFPAQPPIEWQPLDGPLPLPAAGHADLLPARSSRRLARVSTGLASAVARLRDRYDRQGRCGVHRQDPRGGRVDARVLFPGRLGRPRRVDGAQLHVARGARRARRQVGLLILVHINPLAETDDDHRAGQGPRASSRTLSSAPT